MKLLDNLKEKFSSLKNIKKNKEDINDDIVIEDLELDETPERKVRGYDVFYKKKFNFKKHSFPIMLIILSIVFIAVIFVAIKIFTYEGPVETPIVQEEISEMDKIANTIKEKLSLGYEIGVTTKNDLIEKGISYNEEFSGENYFIMKEYTQINEIDHLSTLIFKDNILVGIVHEGILDNSTKYTLSTYFQNFTSYINIAYPNLEISKKWFSEPQIYSVENWNDAVIKNNLELTAEFTNEKDYVKIVGSGIPYTDFLISTRSDQNFGNMVIFYTDQSHQELFSDLEKLNLK